MKLRWPFRKIIAVAEFDFNPSEQNQLPLRKGCQVTVLSKEGDFKGWWKGKIQDRVNITFLSLPLKYMRCGYKVTGFQFSYCQADVSGRELTCVLSSTYV